MESSSSADEEDKFLEEALEGSEELNAEESAESEGSCSSLLHQSISALRSEITIYSYPFREGCRKKNAAKVWSFTKLPSAPPPGLVFFAGKNLPQFFFIGKCICNS